VTGRRRERGEEKNTFYYFSKSQNVHAHVPRAPAARGLIKHSSCRRHSDQSLKIAECPSTVECKHE